MKNIRYFIEQHKHILLILLIAVVLRAFFMGAILYNSGDKGFYPATSEDAGQYWQLAKNLVEHHGFSQDQSPPFTPEVFRTPGYPFFISIFYRIIPAAWFAIIFQNIIALVIILLIYKIVILLFEKKSIASLSALIYAIEPAVIYWNNQLLSETLFIFILLLSIFFFIKNVFLLKRHVLLTGLCLGSLLALAAYTRAVAQFSLFIFIIFSFLSFKKIRQRVALILIMVTSFFVLAGPWLIRNKTIINSYDFSAASRGIGFARYMYTVYINLGGDADGFQKNFRDRSKLTSVKYVLKHPLVFAKIHILSFVPFLMSDSYFTVASTIYPSLEKQRIITEWNGSWNRLRSFWFGHQGIEGLLFFSGKAALLIMNFFAFIGIVFWFFIFKKNRMIALFFLCLIYYFILASGITSYSRLRQPVNPYIFIFAAAGIYWLWDAKIKKYFIHE